MFGCCNELWSLMFSSKALIGGMQLQGKQKDDKFLQIWWLQSKIFFWFMWLIHVYCWPGGSKDILIAWTLFCQQACLCHPCPRPHHLPLCGLHMVLVSKLIRLIHRIPNKNDVSSPFLIFFFLFYKILVIFFFRKKKTNENSLKHWKKNCKNDESSWEKYIYTEKWRKWLYYFSIKTFDMIRNVLVFTNLSRSL